MIKHFTSSGRLVLKTPTGSSHSFLGTTREAVEEHINGYQRDIDRATKRVELLETYLRGETTQDPDALR